MMKRPTFYIDLDRTIFHTERIGEVFPTLEAVYPENIAIRDGYALREQYYVFPHRDDSDEKTYYYDLAGQLREAGIAIDEAFRALRARLGDGQFEYEGADTLIRALRARGNVKVLTYGEDVYQRFKAALCPSLAGAEVITTLEPKAIYLNEHATANDWIVDDKIIAGLSNGMRTVHIQHDRQKPADVHSLAEVAEHIMHSLPLS